MRFVGFIVYVALQALLHASDMTVPRVLVRAEPDHSLVLSLVKDTPVEVSLAPQHHAGCSCCQHGAAGTRMTVTKAKTGQKSCVMPRLRKWSDPEQAARMVKRWGQTLVRTFPQYKEMFLSNQTKLLESLTQLQTKWHDALSKHRHDKLDIHIEPTANGYMEAMESWCASLQKVTDANTR